ncbi:hypothetical protein ABIE67_005236 [Streptomyces sp. V4I8]|uniref:hypothetical protein n=1 Tax=Streptomyces sp. V4I8 TaxID=3156469 RepID=UPI003517D1B9
MQGDAVLCHPAEEPHAEGLPFAFGQRPQQRAERLTLDDQVEAGFARTRLVAAFLTGTLARSRAYQATTVTRLTKAPES